VTRNKSVANQDRGYDRIHPHTERLPGCFNHTYTPSHLLTIEYGSTEQIYGPTGFPVPRPAINLVPSPPGGRCPSKSRPIEQARRYLALLPPAIAGQHGDVHRLQTAKVPVEQIRDAVVRHTRPVYE
jgi:hypothetical protein